MQPVLRELGDPARELARAELLGSPRCCDEPLQGRQVPELIRRAWVRLSGLILRRMDLTNRSYQVSAGEALAATSAGWEVLTGSALKGQLDVLRPRPAIIEGLRLTFEAATTTSLDPGLVLEVRAVVAEALPWCEDDVTGLHPRPKDPALAFAFVGTRYAPRTTPKMISALRERGLRDEAILDLAIVIASVNQCERELRLFGAKG